MQKHEQVDSQSAAFLAKMAEVEQVRANQVQGVRTVLVVLSAKGIVYDIEALRQKILVSYPGTAVFFVSTSGKPMGPAAPAPVDLLIDFTGPGQRQGWFYSRKLRRRARVAVGRNAGLFRKRIYDRVFDEKANNTKLPGEMLARERVVQREVLGLAGVVFTQTGRVPKDRGKTIARELPPYSRL